MNFFTQYKLLKYTVIVLIVINVISLAEVWIFSEKSQHVHHPPPVEHPSPDEYLEHKLGFSEAQLVQFNALNEAHHAEMKTINKQISAEKEILFSSWSEDEDSLRHAQATKVGELESDAEELSYSHFARVREICTENQKIIFDEIILQVIKPHPLPPIEYKEVVIKG